MGNLPIFFIKGQIYLIECFLRQHFSLTKTNTYNVIWNFYNYSNHYFLIQILNFQLIINISQHWIQFITMYAMIYDRFKPKHWCQTGIRTHCLLVRSGFFREIKASVSAVVNLRGNISYGQCLTHNVWEQLWIYEEIPGPVSGSTHNVWEQLWIYKEIPWPVR